MTTEAKSFNPWPAAIIITFVVFFAGTVGLVVLAAHQRVDLVSNDYYEQEIRYQQRLDQVSRTSVVRSQVRVSYDPVARAIRITLPAAHAQGRAVGRVHLYRPSEAGLDRDARLELDPQGVQSVNADKLLPGLWKVRVQWKVDGQDYFVDERVIIPSVPRKSQSGPPAKPGA